MSRERMISDVSHSERKINRTMETEIHVPVGSPTIRKIPIHVDEHNVKDGAIKLIKELRPTWDIYRVKTKVGLGVFIFKPGLVMCTS